MTLSARAWGAITGAAAAAGSAISDAASAAADSRATVYIAAGVLIAGDVVLGGPTGEGIGPALVLIRNGGF